MKILGQYTLKSFTIVRIQYESTSAMAKAIGMSDSMLSRILRGKVSRISDELWDKVKAVFESHCPLGYAHCLIESASEEYKKLVVNLSDIEDVSYLKKLDKQVSRWKEIHQGK